MRGGGRLLVRCALVAAAQAAPFFEAVIGSCVPAWRTPAASGIFHAPTLPRATKVFFLGLQKTGTTTLAKMCDLAGFHARHGTGWYLHNGTVAKFGCFADINLEEGLPNVEALATTYPQAAFFLNSRPLMPWITSLLDHSTAPAKRAGGVD